MFSMMTFARFLLTIIVVSGTLDDSISIADSVKPSSTRHEISVESDKAPAKGRFLVSRRALDDPYFGESIVYLLEHGRYGSMGLIINKPSDVNLLEAIPEIENQNAATEKLFYGGPVGMPTIAVLVNSKNQPEGMIHVDGNIYISSSLTVMDWAIKNGVSRFFIGYSGWGPGQLVREIGHKSWHVVELDEKEIFSTDIDLLWEQLIEELEPAGIQVRPDHNSSIILTQSN